ncbi:MAG: hypothetical protein LBK13_02280 [Spirochaetales bacterium]|jgi:hypothetical protein|nr:hypothetical protein [Spirochaetales bacterium]
MISHFKRGNCPIIAHFFRFGHLLSKFPSRKKPGFPLQVLGFANANPAGFPLQSLAPRSGSTKSLRDFATSQDASVSSKIAYTILRPAPLRSSLEPVPGIAMAIPGRLITVGN